MPITLISLIYAVSDFQRNWENNRDKRSFSKIYARSTRYNHIMYDVYIHIWRIFRLVNAKYYCLELMWFTSINECKLVFLNICFLNDYKNFCLQNVSDKENHLITVQIQTSVRNTNIILHEKYFNNYLSTCYFITNICKSSIARFMVLSKLLKLYL